MDSEAVIYTTVNLNSFTDAPSLQPILEQPLEKKSGSLLARALMLASALAHCKCQLRFAGKLSGRQNHG